MGVGIFGKLPQKRDFVAFDIPRTILEPFESWLQSAVAASRNQMGRSWQDRYLVTPIWRFWGGSEIFGVDCTGAIMPSVDQVGRFFPLAIVYYDESGNGLVPPTRNANEDWYLSLEHRMLQVLDEEAVIDPKTLASGLDSPAEETDNENDAGEHHADGVLWRADAAGDEPLISQIEETDYRATCTGQTFWWTNGGSDFGPLVYSQHGLPDPYFFTSMITGGAR